MTAAYESNILTLTCGNEDNPDAAASLYVKNGISHEKVKLSVLFLVVFGFFFPKSECEHGTRAARREKIYGQFEKNAVLHNGLLICFGKNPSGNSK